MKALDLGYETIADLGNRLDREACIANLRGDLSQPEDGAVDCIFADDASVPTPRGQLVAGDDAPVCARQSDEYLHHSRLEGFAPALALDLSRRWIDSNDTHCERRLMSEHDAARDA